MLFRSELDLPASSYEMTDDKMIALFDGDGTTLYTLPQGDNSLIIRLKKKKKIVGFRYLPNQQRYADGHISSYQVLVDGKEVAQGEFLNINETESLVLEANLIKKNRPKYNINLKDDKQYPYIKITNEKFPKILKVRDIKEDKAQYFGPFPTISDLEKLMELSILIYNIRDCKLNFDKGKFLQRPCMSYYLGRCSAPCT